MPYESEEEEISRLRREQAKARRDEIFGGWSRAERTAYDTRQNHLQELESRRVGLSWRPPKSSSPA